MPEASEPTRSRCSSLRSLVKQRVVLGLMGLFTLANAYCHRFTFGIAITEMVKHKISHHTKIDPNACPYSEEFKDKDTFSYANAEFDWTQEEIKYLQGAFFVGYVITQIPGGIMADSYGGKQIVGFGLLVSALCCLLTPEVSRFGGVYGCYALRIIMGFFQGPTYPSLSNIMSHWAPVEERGRLGAMIFAGAQFGNVVGFMTTGLLISYFHAWESPFYFFGTVGVIWFLLWEVLCYNDPMSHPFIGEAEKTFLMASSVGQMKKRKDLPRAPFFKMLTNIPLWALITAQCGHAWGIVIVLTMMPIYFKSVLHFSLKQNATLSATPNFVMWLFAIVSGYIVDCMIKKGFTVLFVRKLFISIASFGPCFGILIAGYAGCDKMLVSIPFIIGVGTMGAFIPSLKVNSIDLSPNYAGTSLAFVNGIGAATGIFLPTSVAALTPNGPTCPSLSNMMSHWAPIEERGRLGAMIFAECSSFSRAQPMWLWFAAILSGYIVDCMIKSGFGITFVRKLFITIASFGPCLGMLLVGYAHMLAAARFSAHLLNEGLYSLMNFTNLIYVIFGSAEVQEWNVG